MRGVLFRPAGRSPTPAVVVVHGFLANRGFMRTPWVTDLVGSGAAVLLLDRRGHGHSQGTWWPPSNASPERTQDIAAAIEYLRTRGDVVDATRIALLGHSDGGTGVIDTATMDWELAATVSLSASAALVHRVNHVVPANLLLLYGTEDRFILDRSDALLMMHATRGAIAGEGQIGEHANGSARALVRIPGAGHVDLLYDDGARRHALEWLALSLQIETPLQLAAQRRGWVVAGIVSLWAALCFANGPPWRTHGWDFGRPRARNTVARVLSAAALIAAAWACGVWLAAHVAPLLNTVAPLQEAGTAAASLCMGWILLFGVAAIPNEHSTTACRPANEALSKVRALLWGGAAALGVLAAIEWLVAPLFETPVSGPRLVLLSALLVLGLPAWIGIAQALERIRTVLPPPIPEVALAAVTVGLASLWFVRMSVLPMYLVAAVLPFAGAFRAAWWRRGAVAAGAFAAVLYARGASLVCAWY